MIKLFICSLTICSILYINNYIFSFLDFLNNIFNSKPDYNFELINLKTDQFLNLINNNNKLFNNYNQNLFNITNEIGNSLNELKKEQNFLFNINSYFFYFVIIVITILAILLLFKLIKIWNIIKVSSDYSKDVIVFVDTHVKNSKDLIVKNSESLKEHTTGIFKITEKNINDFFNLQKTMENWSINTKSFSNEFIKKINKIKINKKEIDHNFEESLLKKFEKNLNYFQSENLKNLSFLEKKLIFFKKTLSEKYKLFLFDNKAKYENLLCYNYKEVKENFFKNFEFFLNPFVIVNFFLTYFFFEFNDSFQDFDILTFSNLINDLFISFKDILPENFNYENTYLNNNEIFEQLNTDNNSFISNKINNNIENFNFFLKANEDKKDSSIFSSISE